MSDNGDNSDKKKQLTNEEIYNLSRTPDFMKSVLEKEIERIRSVYKVDDLRKRMEERLPVNYWDGSQDLAFNLMHNLCVEIEKLPASTQQTRLISFAVFVRDEISSEIARLERMFAEQSLEIRYLKWRWDSRIMPADQIHSDIGTWISVNVPPKVINEYYLALFHNARVEKVLFIKSGELSKWVMPYTHQDVSNLVTHYMQVPEGWVSL
jgi:hypothetical protein